MREKNLRNLCCNMNMKLICMKETNLIRKDIHQTPCANKSDHEVTAFMWPMREKIYSKEEIYKTSSAITCKKLEEHFLEKGERGSSTGGVKNK